MSDQKQSANDSSHPGLSTLASVASPGQSMQARGPIHLLSMAASKPGASQDMPGQMIPHATCQFQMIEKKVQYPAMPQIGNSIQQGDFAITGQEPGHQSTILTEICGKPKHNYMVVYDGGIDPTGDCSLLKTIRPPPPYPMDKNFSVIKESSRANDSPTPSSLDSSKNSIFSISSASNHGGSTNSPNSGLVRELLVGLGPTKSSGFTTQDTLFLRPGSPHISKTSNEIPPKREMFTGPFLLFKKEKIAMFKESNPNEKIGKDFAVEEWKMASTEQKARYYEQADVEKQELIKNKSFKKTIVTNKKNLEEIKQDKRNRNERYQKAKHEAQIEKEKRFTMLQQKYKEILGKKMQKLAKLKEKNEKLDFMVKQAEVENSVVQQMVKDREGVLVSLKEKYLVLYKSHRSCSKS